MQPATFKLKTPSHTHTHSHSTGTCSELRKKEGGKIAYPLVIIYVNALKNRPKDIFLLGSLLSIFYLFHLFSSKLHFNVF